jgi:hypothetical protein
LDNFFVRVMIEHPTPELALFYHPPPHPRAGCTLPAAFER